MTCPAKPHQLGFQDLVYCVFAVGRLCGDANIAELTRVLPVIHGSYHQSV